MISSLAVTQQQGLLGAFLFLVPAIILSGFATPIANMPRLVQDLTLINPMRYFLVVLRGVFLEGTPFHLLIHPFAAMASIGVVALAAAAWLFRHRMYLRCLERISKRLGQTKPQRAQSSQRESKYLFKTTQYEICLVIGFSSVFSVISVANSFCYRLLNNSGL